MFTFKNGQIWQHHDTDNPVMNNFYNSQGSSYVKTVFNEAMADDKVFRTMVLESDQKWDAAVLTNYTESSITAAEFNTRESRQFSFMRRNEASADYHGRGQGIGVIQNVAGLVLTFSRAPEFVNINDQLCQLIAGVVEVIGTITDVTGAVITVDAITTTPVQGYYAFAAKPARAEGGDVRGYFLEVQLSNDNTEDCDLFAVGTEISKSYV
ncbi:MAG TPA: hypothetical protein VEA58_05455 [Anaerovoracaceae bacterium]|nr:hypothetical protein [Anaerovoracaceae bacterium]